MKTSFASRIARLPPLATFILVAACAAPSAGPERAAIWAASPNHDARRPNYVILHQTSNDNVADALRTLTDPARKVSAHYLVGRDGAVYKLVDETRRAWHAGASYWGGDTDLNSSSIGIELDNNGAEPFAAVQIETLLELLRDIGARHRIPAANYLAHGDIAPRRKADPSAFFPWERLAREGFGLWCRGRDAAAAPTDLDVPLALAALGYENVDPAATLAAFRRHFRGLDSSAPADAADRALLRCLLAEKFGF